MQFPQQLAMDDIKIVNLWEDNKCPANRQWLQGVEWQVEALQRREWLTKDVRIVGEVNYQASAMGAMGDHEETELPLVAVQFCLAIRRPTDYPEWAILWDVSKAHLREAIVNHTLRAKLCPMFPESVDQLHLHHSIFHLNVSHEHWTIPPHRRTQVDQIVHGYHMVPVPVWIQDESTGESLLVPVDFYSIALDKALVDVKFKVSHACNVEGEEGAGCIHAAIKDINVVH
ncbi:hypothetical protein Agabi119p4_7745 [Agaricus bisporus var. burnettii]|uniref:Uncharacterized protein n=1 Tax=Agaricus bisporus var. burnettii TaxID=192524 RepID=A0A8H7EZJ7_AGABI|nr:hypothetical protein Agabi119p4_7745 [Agaricus bisporus var. burnettii]